MASVNDSIEIAMGFDRILFLHGQIPELVSEFSAAFGTATSDDSTSARGSHPSAETAEVSVLFL